MDEEKRPELTDLQEALQGDEAHLETFVQGVHPADLAEFSFENGLTLEVQQQIGDGVVRTIALGSTDGVTRGTGVENTGAPVEPPWSTSRLTR